MSDYRCGHNADTIIMGDSTMGMIWYNMWNESEERKKKHMCFRCFLEKFDFPHRRDMEKQGKEWIHLDSEQQYLINPLEGF